MLEPCAVLPLGFFDIFANLSITAAVLCPTTPTALPVISPTVSYTATWISSFSPRAFAIDQEDVPGASSNKSENLQRLVISELSGITVCSPAPAGSSSKRIVKVSLEIAVTSYSSPFDSTCVSFENTRGMSFATIIDLSRTRFCWSVIVATLTTTSPSDIPAPSTLSPTTIVPEFPSTTKFLVATVIAPATVATTAEAVWKEMISPIAIVASVASWLSTVTDKSPIAPAPFIKFNEPRGCLNALALPHISTPIPLPCVPAVLAAHSP